MLVYCLHEWNYRYDSLAGLHYVVWSCLELLLEQLFTKKGKQWSSQMKLLGSFLAKRIQQNNCEPVLLVNQPVRSLSWPSLAVL